MGREQAMTSLNNTPRPGHSGPDELVPSRYAVRVGDIDVLVISDGVLEPPAESLATNADPVTREAWLDSMFLAHDKFDWALNAVVVRSGSQTILIDSGIGGEVPDFPRAGQFSQRLSPAGVDLDAVNDVVLTHMHFDHVGGMLVDGVKEKLRPDLRVHVSAAEAKFWEATRVRPRLIRDWWRRAPGLCPPTCPSLPSAAWRLRAVSSAGCRPGGTTDRTAVHVLQRRLPTRSGGNRM
jgi:hypothetical protein